MVSDSEWYVLIEDEREVGSAEGTNIHRWELSSPERAAGRAAAEARAEELARTHLPPRPYGRWSERHGRQIYRQPDGSLLVRVLEDYYKVHFRVVAAELVAKMAETRVPKPEPAPRRGLFGRR